MRLGLNQLCICGLLAPILALDATIGAGYVDPIIMSTLIFSSGYLLPWSGAYPVGPTAVGAILLAHERIAELNLLPGVNLQWLWHDSYVLSCSKCQPLC